MKVVKEGSTVSVHYKGTLQDGEQFDSSYDRGEPIQFTVGSGNMIPGFDSGVVGLSIGEKKTLVIEPENAYGLSRPDLVKTFSKSNFPEDFEFNDGDFVQAQSADGNVAFAKIISHEGENVEVDFNHPLAGETLTFEVELMDTTDTE